jgi:hypothetical protein
VAPVSPCGVDAYAVFIATLDEFVVDAVKFTRIVQNGELAINFFGIVHRTDFDR